MPISLVETEIDENDGGGGLKPGQQPEDPGEVRAVSVANPISRWCSEGKNPSAENFDTSLPTFFPLAYQPQMPAEDWRSGD